MPNDLEQLDPLEQMLGELGEAEGAGVFRRTFVNSASLVGGARPRIRLFGTRKLAWIPAAACVMLAIGVGTLALKSGVAPIGGFAQFVGNVSPAVPGELIGFHECLGGPGGAAVNGCLVHDYDSDGDVDLADFTAYQSAGGR